MVVPCRAISSGSARCALVRGSNEDVSTQVQPRSGAGQATIRPAPLILAHTFPLKLPARSNSRRVVAGLVLEPRSEEHTSELQSLMRLSYAVFCLKKKKKNKQRTKSPNTENKQST